MTLILILLIKYKVSIPFELGQAPPMNYRSLSSLMGYMHRNLINPQRLEGIPMTRQCQRVSCTAKFIITYAHLDTDVDDVIG